MKRGKFETPRKYRNSRNKTLVLVLSLVLVMGCVVGGTLAWLTAKTDEVKNTFTYGDINIELSETTGSEYKMIPGTNLSKDPKVTVKANSEACWLFVKIVEGGSVTIGSTTYTFDEFLTYAIADGWTKLQQTPEEEKANVNETYVYYREVTATDAMNGVSYYVLKGDTTNTNGCVTVNSTVTKEMMNAIDGIDANGSTDSDAAKAEVANRPTLTFTAYAVQKEGFATATAAWAEINK